MRLRSLLFVWFLIFCLFPLPALATGLNDNCGWTDGNGVLVTSPAQSAERVVNAGTILFYQWENSVHPNCDATRDSSAIIVRATSVLVRCNLDEDAVNTAAPGGVIQLRWCHNRALRNANACISLGDLTGIEGTAATQTAAVEGPPGTYFLDVSTDIPDNGLAVCEIQGL